MKNMQEWNQCLDYLIDSSFQRVNRFFVFLFENNSDQESYERYYIPEIEIKGWNFITDGKTFSINQ